MANRKINNNRSYTRRLISGLGGKRPLDVLAATPVRMKHAIHDLSERQLRKPPARGKWSIAQIVAHLCDGELVLGYRFRKVIAEPGCEIQAYDQDAWAKRLRYEHTDTHERVALFSFLRKNNISLLRALTPKEWKLSGIHSERGVESVSRMALMYAGHDINHLKQIDAIVRNVKKPAHN